jgi:phosphoribosylamine--glycine ligase
MKVLVIGSGGREHALVWKIAQSRQVSKVYAAPGNAGIAEEACCLDIKIEDIEGIKKFAKKEGIDLVVVGPEAPLASGITNELTGEGISIFGPTKEAARLEASKVFAKQMMRKYNVPTADFEIFDNAEKAKGYVKAKPTAVVVKADGLAAGKGVIVCDDQQQARSAIKSVMEDKVFGQAGDRVVIEDRLFGQEASIIVVTDGTNVSPLASSQDHKRIFDNDRGANTGGMGAYSPAPVVSEELFGQIMNEIIYPIIKGISQEGFPYRGILYAGIMITDDGPKVLEFNVRFGDPETQAIMPRLKSDLVEIMQATIDGNLDALELVWDSRACVCVVLASGGYPGDYQKGKEIFGLDEIKKLSDVVVFHAGTRKKDNRIITSGGRVLGVTGLGQNIKEAIDRTYEAVGKIHFEGMHYRKDIGFKAISNIKNQISKWQCKIQSDRPRFKNQKS